jgi:spoIIIJ-associated protein
MSGFFSKIFGVGRKKDFVEAEGASVAVERLLATLIEKTGLEIEAQVTSTGTAPEEEISVEFSGPDQDFLLEKEGALLDSFQLFVKRALQHQISESRANVTLDCDGFREATNRSLVELAERLKERALEQGRAVYLRALSPKDRKVIHQHLATDDRVRSRSVGEGLYKKIKIYPTKGEDGAPGGGEPRGGGRGRRPSPRSGSFSGSPRDAREESPEESPQAPTQLSPTTAHESVALQADTSIEEASPATT